MEIHLDPSKIEDYHKFLKIKSIPCYRIRGRTAFIPDEYAGMLGESAVAAPVAKYSPLSAMFDYQRDITAMAIEKRKFSVFARCGLGKSLILMDYAKHAADCLPKRKKVLIIDPLMVIPQMQEECERWYGNDLAIRQVRSNEINEWLSGGDGQIGITNYEAIDRVVDRGELGALILDESSQLKAISGKHATKCIELGRGLEWKLALTGTPAPNDRIEYANHAVFMDQFRTTNEFLARYFINRGETQNRWEIKPHALKPFYRDLSHWCIFLNNPATYGWKDNSAPLPPIHTHFHHVEMTDEQYHAIRKVTGNISVTTSGGIGQRGKLAQISKGHLGKEKIPTNKPEFIRELIASWPDESTIVWCKYNPEQEYLASILPNVADISGSTPHEKRMELIADFKARRRMTLSSKPDILGFGLNLQVATRQVFSTCMDSFEDWWQCVCRSNRTGSTLPLNVHIPTTEAEAPMVDNVMRKAKRVEQDIEEQEYIFKEMRLCC